MITNASALIGGYAQELAFVVDELYLSLLLHAYDKPNKKKALKIVGLLDSLFARNPKIAMTIKGEELSALMAEVRGDMASAIYHRENELRKIFELYLLAMASEPSWNQAMKQYDYAAVSDRMDLLATMYADIGNIQQAISILNESKLFCMAHGAEFDGYDLLHEYEEKLEDMQHTREPENDE